MKTDPITEFEMSAILGDTFDDNNNNDNNDNNNNDSLETVIKSIIYKHHTKIDTKWVDINQIYESIKSSVPSNINLNELYEYISNYCAGKSSTHPDYNTLASMICVDRLHSVTASDILEVADMLYNNLDKKGRPQPLINEQLHNIIKKNYKKINEKIDMSRDYLLDYFGIRTLERSYLLKSYDKHGKKTIVERPQHLFMRVALGIHGTSIKCAFETYDLMSQKYMTHATPTLFNAGTTCQQLSSCYLLAIDDDLHNIFTKQTEIGMISKRAGGIGVHLSGIRSKGSLIRGTNGLSEGIIPLCSVLNKQSRYVNQGGKRPGSIACYLEPHHADIFEFVELRKQNTGTDDNRARDLFLALWISNLFMRRVEADEMWSLMCPDECPNLNKTFGEEFEKLYESYESKGMFVRQVKARDLWRHIIECQIETGFPYMLYKDHVNEKSNQKNLGTICSSNLCCEICEYSDADNTAVCNLASLCLPRYIIYNGDFPEFDYNKLATVTRVLVRNLNKIIDINFYPSVEAKKSNKNTRPIGIGVQGLNCVYNIFKISYESPEACDLNKKIFETIYYAAIDESKELAKLHGAYKTFAGSPFSEGKLQFHLWGLTERDLLTRDMFDWKKLITEVKTYGTYNSLLTALMPTASTSQIMKCCESFEPCMSNVFVRTTMAGEFMVVNEYLIRDLIKLNLWNEDMRKKIIIENGSIQNIKEIPNKIKSIYKTAFEMGLKSIIKQSVERAPFIDQSQSMNLFMDDPSYWRLTSAHFYGWKSGIKTGMYYMRGAPAVNPIQFGVDMTDILRLSNYANVKEYLTAQTNANKRKNDKDTPNNPTKMCKFVPGKKAEGCEMCSA